QKMPGMSGLETAQAILARRPRQRIVMCSAYVDADLVRRAEDAGIHHCLTKGDIGRIPDTLRKVAAEA
ncbi:MAG: response regulator, partial [Actinomycetota bacterium]